MSTGRRTSIERAVLGDGLTIAAAVKKGAVDQIGRLVDALDAEVTRIAESDGPLDVAAAHRVARTWRQLVPIMEMQERAAPGPTTTPPPAPLTLTQRIAAETSSTPEAISNGHAVPTA